MKRDHGLTARMAFTILMLSFAYVALIGILFWAGINPYLIFGFGIIMVFFQYFMSDKLVLAATKAKVVTEKELELVTSDLASKIASKSPLTLRVGKEAFYRQLEMDLDSAYRYTSEVMAQNMMAAEAQEGIDAFMQKRDPVWKGA